MDNPELNITSRDVNLQILMLSGKLMQVAEHILEGTSLTPVRSRVLGIVSRADGAAVTVGEISRILAQSRQATAFLVRRMAADGLLDLEENPRHRRAFLVRATPTGASLYETSNARQNVFNDALDRALVDQDIALLAVLLERYGRTVDRTLSLPELGAEQPICQE